MSIFNEVSRRAPKTSKHNISEEFKLSCNFGQLIPIMCKETLPGDRFRINTELLIKLAPLKAPVMHRLTAYVHYFYVPMYQLSRVYEKFMNPKTNDGSIELPWSLTHDAIGDTDPISQRYPDVANLMGIGSLADYMALPITQPGFKPMNEYVTLPPVLPVNDFNLGPFAAYQHIYNSYYRDQNMELLPSEGGNAETTTLFDLEGYKDLVGHVTKEDLGVNQFRNLFKLRNRAWKKDYFTSALPSPQAGEDVLIPMGFDSDVDFSIAGTASQTGSSNTIFGTFEGSSELGMYAGAITPSTKVSARASAMNTTFTINDFRRAMAAQRFKELSERGGTRLPEMLFNFFNVRVPDYMVDRPVYLGGQKTPISVGEVVQTSQTTNGEDGSAQGTRAGIASAYGKTKNVRFKSPMHGFILGILSIRPEATYAQGIERMWTRRSVFDYAWPQFANLGEQEIYEKEIYTNGYTENDDKVFGYSPRYAEYKEGHCHVAGEFRPGRSLDYWHFGRKFDNAPQLNKDFIMMDQMNYEPFNVTSEETEHVYVNLYNNIHSRRPLPFFGTPSIL